MLITEFYEGQDIFITGGSGFIGKALIEKLLYSCSNFGRIFVLLRGKKGKNAEERLQHILNMALFKRVREERPHTFRRVHAIDGDCSELGLGIKPEDLPKLQNVSIIFHSAATVRFNEPLRYAILLNTRATYELVKIAETLKKLKVFVHVSTTYCNPDQAITEEKVYPSQYDWRTTIKMAETFDEEVLNILTVKYYKNSPNTYVFTKGLTEQIIKEFQHKLPLIIFRPAVVTSGYNEPAVGWFDNFNGPMGILITCGLGLIRTSYGDGTNNLAVIPVDIVVRSMLVAGYRRGTQYAKESSTEVNQELEVINCTNSNLNPMTLYDMVDAMRVCVKKLPLENIVWWPAGTMTSCFAWHWIRMVLMHILVPSIVDFIILLLKKKPFLVRAHRQIHFGFLGLSFFMHKKWVFADDHFKALDSFVPKSELDTFAFMHLTKFNYNEYFLRFYRGAKMFMLNEPPVSSRGAHIRLKLFHVAHIITMTACSYYVLRFLGRFILARFF